MARIIQQIGLFTALGFLAGCKPPPVVIPGEDSPTGQAFQEIAMEMYGEDVDMLTPSQALDVLESAVHQENPGSAANLNAASVALGKGDDVKAIDHLEKFLEKLEADRAKGKLDDADADFMWFVAQSIIEGINEEGGGA